MALRGPRRYSEVGGENAALLYSSRVSAYNENALQFSVVVVLGEELWLLDELPDDDLDSALHLSGLTFRIPQQKANSGYALGLVL